MDVCNKGPYRITRRINDANFVVKRSPKAKGEIVHIDRLIRYRGTVPQQWNNEIQHDTTLESLDGDDIMNNADEESESALPAVLDPLGDNSDSGESSLERLNGPLVDTLTQASESDRGPSQLASDRVTYDELQTVGNQPSDPGCGKRLIDTPLSSPRGWLSSRKICYNVSNSVEVAADNSIEFSCMLVRSSCAMDRSPSRRTTPSLGLLDKHSLANRRQCCVDK